VVLCLLIYQGRLRKTQTVLLSDNCGSFAGGEIRSRQTRSGPIRCCARKATQYPLAPPAGRGSGEGRSGRMACRFIRAQEGGFIADFPNLPSGWSQGENPDEALAQAEDLRGTRPLQILCVPCRPGNGGRASIRGADRDSCADSQPMPLPIYISLAHQAFEFDFTGLSRMVIIRLSDRGAKAAQTQHLESVDAQPHISARNECEGERCRR
jgi:hypothetical protein